MATFFCDASALVKRYVSESGSIWLTLTIDPHVGSRVFIAQITIVEVVAAITRREKGGHLLSTDAITALKTFEQDYNQELSIVPLTTSLVNDAVMLSRKYALRGYDAIQLSTALQTFRKRAASNLLQITLLSADAELNAAAKAEGLLVENPNDHP